MGQGGWYWIRQGHTLGHFNVGTGCRYWITEVIELDDIVVDMFYYTKLLGILEPHFLGPRPWHTPNYNIAYDVKLHGAITSFYIYKQKAK